MDKKNNLIKLTEILKRKIPDGENLHYEVPDLWNCFGYNGPEKISYNGVLFVNPYRFYSECIDNYILKSKTTEADFLKSISQITGQFHPNNSFIGGDWIKAASIYSMQIRTSTSWDHDADGYLSDYSPNGFKETGTFVKSIALLPLLKKMGVNTVYLLPISMHSHKNQKGEVGSCYAVKNFFSLDSELKDPITGDAMSVEDEFRAFTEACHMLNMRIMIDIIPRTCSRDNDLIFSHPDWFYWIRTKDLPYYGPPDVPGVGKNLKPSPELLDKLYASQDVQNLIKKFTVSPDKYNAQCWIWIKEQVSSNPNVNILELIEQHMEITTAPAFSDCINDPQPPWDDVTYFRMYWDHPVESQKYMKDPYQAPYILNDTIKCNIFEGNYPNEELWNMLADIIPHYQRNFGIDGARIDMGHALPNDLVKRILYKPRELDKDFCFIAEELLDEGASAAKSLSYNMIIGHSFYVEPRWKDPYIHDYIYGLKYLPCPILAAGETPDTPRLSARDGGRNLAKCLVVLNNFIPNGVPFISSGLEIFETQPMNTGLDCRQNERWMLHPDDKYNGKLAFFDKYQLHWNNPSRWEIPDTLTEVSKIRKTFIDTLTNLDNFVPIRCGESSSSGIALGWIVQGKKGEHSQNLLLVLANADMYNYRDLYFDLDEIRKQSHNASKQGHLIYSTNEDQRPIYDFDDKWNLKLHFAPGEVKIIIM